MVEDGAERYCVVEHPALAERSVGALANLTVVEIERVIRDDPRYPDPPPQWKSDSHYRLPYAGAESLLDAGLRVASEINRVMEGCRNRAAALHVFVGHGAAFRHAAYHQGMLEFDAIAQLSMHHCMPMAFAVDADQHWHHLAGAWKQRSQRSQHLEKYVD